ncbi:MAG TPA: hypothetical protein VMT18_01860 [Planctomycetota bacterium]|nr:hypothetical protein [Planctomycetota bacterium]
MEPAIARSQIELAVLACAVVGRLGSRLAAPALTEVLDASEPRLRRAARAALQRLGRHEQSPRSRPARRPFTR